jgi:PAS domain S-box-containing protein
LPDPLSFLLVDDDAFFLETIRPLLERSSPGSRVTTASSYADGLSAIPSLPPHAVLISDFDLRDSRDGADLLAEAERLRPDVTRILCSGHSREALGYAFVRCRPHAFVQKTVRIEEIVAPLTTAVRKLAGGRAADPYSSPDEMLRQNSEIYRLLVESVKDYAIFVIDPTGHIASWNLGAERIKGYKANEVIGQHFRLFYTPEDQNRHHPEAELQLALAHGRYEEEGVRVRRDGSRFWANIVLTPLYGPDGTLRGFAKVTRDLTARKAQEEQMRRHTRELEDLSQELEAFSYTVAHDLRSPLRMLLFEAHKARAHTEEAGLAHLDGIERQADRMNALIDDLLQLAQAGKGQLQVQEVDLSVLARDAAADVVARHGHPDTKVTIQDGIVVQADPRGLRVVLDNLLSNAAKFTSRAKDPSIEVGAMKTPQGHVCYVRDNGAGLDPSQADRLFRPFQRLHSGQEYEGTGLGLATVRRVIERHGGRVWIDGKPGQGATAYFLLHANPTDFLAGQQAPAAAAAPPVTVPPRPAKEGSLPGRNA